MPVTQAQILNAKQVQDLAAQDQTQTVRLVAGPGTGKSFVIEGRVLHLLRTLNIDPRHVIAVSFTRASAKDLKDRINAHCLNNHQGNVVDVRVSTLHSLALYLLRHTGKLNLFATDPMILDDWETENIFDAEFSQTGNRSPTRSGEIRMDHEAFWSTGAWGPTNLPPIATPITTAERSSFNAHYVARTQAYCCVLPGEVIRTCVTQIQGGHINPVQELGVEYLIVDEVQDLNPCDFEFIYLLIGLGVNVFISGDDDQSVYSFRYAFPFGIQNFTVKYPHSGEHVLRDCFRCTPSILAAAIDVINTFPAQNRIQKNLISVYSNSNPPLAGFIKGNIFNGPNNEASFIASSCQNLIQAGVSPNDIMILISNRRFQLGDITNALQAYNVEFDAFIREEFKDSDYGRFITSLLRILENANDYVAHRILLSTQRGIGIGTCCNITDKVLSNNINFKDLFYQPLPNGVFSSREVGSIQKVVSILNAIQGWNLNDDLTLRAPSIVQLIQANFSASDASNANGYLSSLPGNLTLDELKDVIQTDSQEAKDRVIDAALLRVVNNVAPQQPHPKIKVISYHSSKGLSAKIVFLPGLEEGVFPNVRAQQIPGLVLESGRLMYVAITRAKVACIMSYVRKRRIFGKLTQMQPSRYCVATGVHFAQQANGSLLAAEIHGIQNEINLL